MASMQIREAELDRDVPGLVALIRETSPSVVVNEALWLFRHRTMPERASSFLLVAEAEGEVVGQVRASLDFVTGHTKALCSVAVRAAHRWRGIGSALYEAGEAHVATLGAGRVVSAFEENDLGVRFALDRGFVESRAEAISVLDPRSVSLAMPDGVSVVPASDVDPRILHRLEMATVKDMPYDGTLEELEYDDWAADVFGNPLFQPEGSFVAYAGGEPAALTLLVADPDTGRGAAMYTGTLSEFRKRGLALATKVAMTHWAAANGLTRLTAMNDERNAGMLAINRRLGYQPAGRRVEYVKALAGTSSAPAPPAPAM